MGRYRKSLLAVLATLSLQSQAHFQTALADIPEPVGQVITLADEDRNLGQDVKAVEQEAEALPKPAIAADSDDFFCCLTEILLLVGLVGIGILGANGIMWLIEQGDKDR